MGKKKVKATVKLAIEAGKATPAPPVGPALGQHGLNIMEFCKAYNEKTAAQSGYIIPAVITVYEDRTFTFVTKTPPTSELIRKAAGVDKGSTKPGREKVGKLTQAKVREIAETKLADLNAFSIESAVKQVVGAARSMGVEVVD